MYQKTKIKVPYWYKAFYVHKETGKRLPFVGEDATKKLAKRKLIKLIQKSKFNASLVKHSNYIDEQGKKKSKTEFLYDVVFDEDFFLWPRD